MKTQVMLDLETLGKKPGSIILSIGAVKFDDGQITDEFYCRVDAESCDQIGLVMDASTVMWWLNQSEEARREVAQPGEPIIAVLTRFAVWLGDIDANVWANAPTFDCALMHEAYDKAKLARPWKHHNERCYRTARALLPRLEMQREGTHHNALDDARFQARYLMAIMGASPLAAARREIGDLRSELLCLCEKMEEGINGPEETKRARALLDRLKSNG